MLRNRHLGPRLALAGCSLVGDGQRLPPLLAVVGVLCALAIGSTHRAGVVAGEELIEVGGVEIEVGIYEVAVATQALLLDIPDEPEDHCSLG